MTKERLRQYRPLIKQLRYLEERAANYKAMCESQGIRITDMPKGGVMPDYLVKYLDIERIIEIKRSEIVCELAAIETFIQSIPDSTAQAIIDYRYIRGWSWTKIARMVHYSRRQTINILNKYIEKSL